MCRSTDNTVDLGNFCKNKTIITGYCPILNQPWIVVLLQVKQIIANVAERFAKTKIKQ
jgi:hypothetical protein